jgi:hypothetical protein
MQQGAALAAGPEDRPTERLSWGRSPSYRKTVGLIVIYLIASGARRNGLSFAFLDGREKQRFSVFGISSSCHPGDKKTQYSAVIIDLRHFSDH